MLLISSLEFGVRTLLFEAMSEHKAHGTHFVDDRRFSVVRSFKDLGMLSLEAFLHLEEVL